MNIKVQTNKGVLDYEVTEDILIVCLKVLVGLMEECHPNNFWLTFEGKILENDKPLSHYKIMDGACLIAGGELTPSNVESQPSLLPKSNIRTLLRRMRELYYIT